MFTPRPLTETEQALEDACAKRATEFPHLFEAVAKRALQALEVDRAKLDAEIARIAVAACKPADIGKTQSGLSQEFVSAIVAGVGLAQPSDDDLRRVDTAITRARVVRACIDHFRDAVTNGHNKAALLASYDAELSRLVLVPGVMDALLDDMQAIQDHMDSEDRL